MNTIVDRLWRLWLTAPLLLAGACGAEAPGSPCGDSFHLDDGDRCVRWVELQRVVAPTAPGSLLQLDDGRVLVWSESGPMLVLTPDARRWDPIQPPPLRYIAAASTLPDGSVLAIGGPGDPRFAARWDPIADVWSAPTSLEVARVAQMAPLADGSLLLVGRDETPGFASWRYDGDLATLTRVGDPTSGAGSLVALDDGRVMKLGHDNDLAFTVEIFDPATGAWTPEVTPMEDVPCVPGELPDVTSLGDAGVLLVAGERTEIYSPVVASWRAAGATLHGGRCADVTTLSDGTALAVGTGVGATAAIYDPRSGAWTETWQAPVPRLEPAACWSLLTLPDGRVLAREGPRSVIYEQEPPRDDLP